MDNTYRQQIDGRFWLTWFPASLEFIKDGKQWMVTEKIDDMDYCRGFYKTKRQAVESVSK